MKNLYLLAVLAFAFTQYLYAQNPAGEMVTNSRLIGTSGDQWASNAWEDFDTVALSYTGTRGGGIENNQIVADCDVQQRWSINGGALNNNSLYERTYNASNQVTQSTLKNWIAGAWTNYQRTTYTYNAQGQNTVTLYENGNGTGPTDWNASVRYTSTYDANGNVTTYQRDDWNGSNWGGYQKTIYTYDSADRLSTTTLQVYTGGMWRNDTKYTYIYNANGLRETFNHENWDGNAWVPYRRTNYTYNAQGKTLTTVIEAYSAGAWNNFDKVTNTYNGQGYLIETVTEEGSISGWENYQKTTHVRNAQGLSTEQILYNWQNGTSSWLENTRQTRTYDAAGNRLTEVSSYYINGTWNDGYANTQTFNQYNQVVSRILEEDFGAGLQNISRTLYYYEDYEDGTSGINTIPNLASSVQPNPFTINVAINVTATQAGEHTFEVYNLAGQKVHTETRNWAAGAQTLVFDGQELPKGIYIYQISSASGTAKGKLVKQ